MSSLRDLLNKVCSMDPVIETSIVDLARFPKHVQWLSDVRR